MNPISISHQLDKRIMLDSLADPLSIDTGYIDLFWIKAGRPDSSASLERLHFIARFEAETTIIPTIIGDSRQFRLVALCGSSSKLTTRQIETSISGLELEWFEKLKRALQESDISEPPQGPSDDKGVEPNRIDTLQNEVLQLLRDISQKTTNKELGNRYDIFRLRKASLSSALAGIANTWRREKTRTSFEETLSNPLHIALAELCDISGISITARRVPESHDPLYTFCRTMSLRYRRLRLNGQWWKEATDPLLGFLAKDMSPVLLLPDKHGRYYIRPTGHTSYEKHKASDPQVLITEQTAKELSKHAIVLYRPFIGSTLQPRDIILHGIKSAKKDFATVCMMGALGGLLASAIPYITGIIFDTVIPHADRQTLYLVVMLLCSSALACALFALVQSTTLSRLEGKMSLEIQAAMWDRLLRLPAPFFRRFGAGNLAMRAQSIEAIRAMLSGVVLQSLIGGVFSIFAFALLFYYDSWLALIATALVALVMSIVIVINYIALKYNRATQATAITISGTVLGLVSAVSKLRMTNSESGAFAHWSKQYSKQRQDQSSARILQYYADTLLDFFPIVATMILFFYYATSGEKDLSTGEFLAFYAAFTLFLTSVLGVARSFSSVLVAIPLYENAKPILLEPLEMQEGSADPGLLRGGLELCHVAFGYDPDAPPVLTDISLKIEPGEFVAFVGPSGSGKSTIFRLLLGFETPISGTIYFDGQDLAKLDIAALRRQLGVVLQNGKLLPGDIFTNIIGSSSTLTLDDAWQAAEMAGLADDIREMPMGIHSVISEGGSTLSGGQRQRLLIARAIAKKPRILLMDEATSALDNRTQSIVSQSLERLKTTRIVIAHRLSTVEKADKIAVVSGGVIQELGNYDELMAKNGVFATLARRQL